MKNYHLQLLERPNRAHFWQELIERFTHEGEEFELRLWEDERDCLNPLLPYLASIPNTETTETVYRGVLTATTKALLFAAEVGDADGFVKLTPFFTLIFFSEAVVLSSEHYGTELILQNLNDAQDAALWQLLEPISDCFSILVY